MSNESYLKSLQNQYDETLKELENRPDDFRSEDYSVYFKDKVFEDEILKNMSETDRNAYGTGAGGELKDANNGIPAKMKSVASSSRFCYLSLKDTDFSVFGVKNRSFVRRFEERLPVVRGTAPHMDCYYEDGDVIVCFECKCHEQFNDHTFELSESYFSKDRIVTKIPENFILEKHKPYVKRDKNGVEHTYYNNIINPEVVGLTDNPRFDVEQFFTHIMGIQARMQKTNKSKARLIYYYFIPNNAQKGNGKICEVVKKLYSEIQTVFNSPFITKNIDNISFELYVQYSDVVENAEHTNTKQIDLSTIES